MILLAKCFNSVKPLTLLSNPALPFSHDSSLQDSSKDSSKIPGDNDEGGRRGRGDNERRGEKKKNGDLSSSAHSAILSALSCRERGERWTPVPLIPTINRVALLNTPWGGIVVKMTVKDALLLDSTF